MSLIKKIILVSFLIISLGLALYFLKEGKNKNSIIPVYEKEVVRYFKEIALQSEFEDNPLKVIKWAEPMILFVRKEGEFKPQMLEIKQTINEINELTSDGFKILLTDDVSNSNSVLFLCDLSRLSKLAPYFYDVIAKDVNYDISGYAYSEFDTKTYIIDKALVFINIEDPIETQKATIKEEITQSLGLAFDSKKYANSIFYEDKYKQKDRVKEYSDIDKDILSLLYDPKMKPGLNSIELDLAIKEIFDSKKKIISEK